MAENQEQLRTIRLLLTGGGTGGHLFPAVATAQNLCDRFPGSRVLFIGTNRKLDRTHLERYGYTVRTVLSYGLKGKKIPALLKALAVLPLALVQACYHILRFRPHVVCGVGGYVTGPVVAAAWLLRKPTIIHEQNSVPGLANRKLGRFVDKVCISLPGSELFFPAGKTVLTGNPVRSQILDLVKSGPRQAEYLTLVVLGGSQGAHAINEAVVNVLCTEDTGSLQLRIIHQTGVEDEAMVRKAYEQAGVEATVRSFFDDMVDVYRQSDIVISRAGATTLAELAVLGKPAILIPYPFAADNHQEKNGLRFTEGGGAIMILQKELTPEKLAAELKKLISNPGILNGMSQAMQQMGIPDAPDRIVDICLEMSC